MKVIYQCFGITGVILALYGLLAFAVTQVSTWFFWTLLIGGIVLILLFVMTTLSRAWQDTLASLVALNAPWIILLSGKEWPVWKLAVGGGICAVALITIGLKRIKIVGPVVGILAATFAALLYFKGKPWAGYALLGCAFLYNGAFLFLSRQYLKDMFQRRSLRYSTNAIVYTVIVLAIVVVANLMSQDFHAQKDFTEASVNTLTEQSVKIVKGLKSPVKITAFFDDRNPGKAPLRDLLSSYRFQSKNVEIAFVDPDKDKTLAVQHNAKDGDILVEYGEQNNVTREVNEQGITQAIIKVARTSTPMVCFTKGHGEMDIDGTDEEERSLSTIKGGMTNEGFQSKAVESVAGEVPAECSTLVVAGPTQAFTAPEAAALDRYMERGGNLFLMLDPNVPDPRLATANYGVLPTGLEEVTKKWGVELGRNFILEKHLQIFQGVRVELTVLAQMYGNHPIVDPLKGKQTVFDRVRSVRPVAGFGGTTVELISSAAAGASWAESDIKALFFQKSATAGPDDIEGPVPIAVASEKTGAKEGEAPPQTSKMIVIGDSDFISNGMVRSYEFNFDLFLNALNWTQGETEQISIRPKMIRSSTIELTPVQSNTIFYIAIIGLPMLVLIFGMDLWWFRRRRG